MDITNWHKIKIFPLDEFLIKRCKQYPHVIKEFIRFLMMHNAYGKYVFNYANASDYWKLIYHRGGAITPNKFFLRAFSWEKTPEGEDYWRNLNKMWGWKLLKLLTDLKVEIE